MADWERCVALAAGTPGAIGTAATGCLLRALLLLLTVPVLQLMQLSTSGHCQAASATCCTVKLVRAEGQKVKRGW